MRVTLRSCSTRSSRALHAQRHVADLVEKERAAIGLLDEAAVGACRAREGASHVAEQLGLDQTLGNGGAVHGNPVAGTVLAAPVMQQPARPPPCPHPTRPLMSTASTLSTQALQQGFDLAHRGRDAQHRCLSARCVPITAKPVHAHHQLIEVERLRDEVDRAGLQQSHRFVDGPKPRHEHERRPSARRPVDSKISCPEMSGSRRSHSTARIAAAFERGNAGRPVRCHSNVKPSMRNRSQQRLGEQFVVLDRDRSVGAVLMRRTSKRWVVDPAARSVRMQRQSDFECRLAPRAGQADACRPSK